MGYPTLIRGCAAVLSMCVGLAAPVLAGDGGLRLEGCEVAAETDSGLGDRWLRLDEQPAVAADLPISSGTRFYFRVAGWYTFLNGNLSYGDPVNGVPVDLDLENVLDYDTDLLTLRGEFGVTFAERFHVDVAINGPFNYDGATSRTVSFGDFSYAADADSELDFISLEGTFGYDVVKQDTFRLWLGAGLRAVALHFEVEGQATDRNGNVIGTQKEEIDAGAAIPVVGLGLRWDFSRNFYVAARGMGLYVGNYGNAFDVSAEVGWDFTKNFGVFAGYKFSHFEANEIEVDDFDLDIDGDLHGPYAGVEVRF